MHYNSFEGFCFWCTCFSCIINLLSVNIIASSAFHCFSSVAYIYLRVLCSGHLLFRSLLTVLFMLPSYQKIQHVCNKLEPRMLFFMLPCLQAHLYSVKLPFHCLCSMHVCIMSYAGPLQRGRRRGGAGGQPPSTFQEGGHSPPPPTFEQFILYLY